MSFRPDSQAFAASKRAKVAGDSAKILFASLPEVVVDFATYLFRDSY